MSANKTDKLRVLIGEQEEILNSLKREAEGLSSSDLFEENERLAASVKAQSEKAQSLEEENNNLKKELDKTKSALFRKMSEEKLLAFSAVQKKIDNMYYNTDSFEENRLASYERNTLKSIEKTKRFIEQQTDGSYNDIIGKLEQLKSETYERQKRLHEMKSAELSNARRHNNLVGESLKNEPLTENEKRAGLAQRSLESFIGLNILSKAGIFLFIIGIILAGRYAYMHIGNGLKDGLIFLLGAVLIALGEVFNSKEKTVFSNALISGGVSVLYGAAVTGYFAFGLFSEQVVFMICIAITAVAIALAYQIQSEVVCGFAAVGGYLPLVAIFMMGFGKVKANAMFLPVACIYFTLLAITLFVMSYNKKWSVAMFTGYGLHLVALGAVSSCAWELRELAGFENSLKLAVAFSIAAYIVYLLYPAVKIITKKAFTIGDAILLAFNTVSGAVSINITVNNYCTSISSANKAMGFVFLGFAVVYAVLMYFSIGSKEEKNTAASAITSISALIFSMFVIPLIFGFEYAAIAWALEGAALAYFSMSRGYSVPEYAGLGCMVLSVFACGLTMIEEESYTLIAILTFGAVALSFLTYSVKGLLTCNKNGNDGRFYAFCEILSVAGTAGFVYYIYNALLNSNFISIYSDFTDGAVLIAIILIAALVLRVGIMKNSASMLISDICGGVLMLLTAFYLDASNKYNYFVYGNVVRQGNGVLLALNLALLVVINLAVLLFFAKSVASIISNTMAPVWINTAALSASSLVLITITLMNQFGVGFSSYIISGVYIIAACVMLFIGFKKNYSVIRTGGLAIILAAFAKLCFVDTFHLVTGWKIVSYFAFGAILIAISYFYQRFDKKLQKAERITIEE